MECTSDWRKGCCEKMMSVIGGEIETRDCGFLRVYEFG